MKKVVSLGEILLRLSPPQYQTLKQATSLDCQFGGSELNVISSLAQLGHQVSLISAIPDNDLGQMTKNFLFSRQINQEHIIEKGQRLGIYYYQKGFSLRAVGLPMTAVIQLFGSQSVLTMIWSMFLMRLIGFMCLG